MEYLHTIKDLDLNKKGTIHKQATSFFGLLFSLLRDRTQNTQIFLTNIQGETEFGLCKYSDVYGCFLQFVFTWFLLNFTLHIQKTLI